MPDSVHRKRTTFETPSLTANRKIESDLSMRTIVNYFLETRSTKEDRQKPVFLSRYNILIHFSILSARLGFGSGGSGSEYDQFPSPKTLFDASTSLSYING